jgi:NAD(P)-dependent dehydrogenase (short-subunit alcohol dehydrogenase family)
MRPIDRQVVVITGASSGIGRCAALHLSGMGARLGLFARDADALDELRVEIERLGGQAVTVAGDVTREKDVDRLAREVVGTYGRIDTWVNNAAVFIQGLADEIEPAEYRRVIDVDLVGTILGTRRALQQMKEQGEGVVIQVSSIVAQRGAPYFSAYSAAKRGVVGFTQSVRSELWGTDIKVSLLYLPSVDTPIYNNARSKFGTVPRPAPPIWSPRDAAIGIAELAESGGVSRTVGWFHWIYRAPDAISHRLGDWFLNRTGHFTLSDIPTNGDNLEDPAPRPREIRGGWAPRAGWRGLRLEPIAKAFPVLSKVAAGGVALLALEALRRR